MKRVTKRFCVPDLVPGLVGFWFLEFFWGWEGFGTWLLILKQYTLTTLWLQSNMKATIFWSPCVIFWPWVTLLGLLYCIIIWEVSEKLLCFIYLWVLVSWGRAEAFLLEGCGNGEGVKEFGAVSGALRGEQPRSASLCMEAPARNQTSPK